MHLCEKKKTTNWLLTHSCVSVVMSKKVLRLGRHWPGGLLLPRVMGLLHILLRSFHTEPILKLVALKHVRQVLASNPITRSMQHC